MIYKALFTESLYHKIFFRFLVTYSRIADPVRILSNSKCTIWFFEKCIIFITNKAVDPHSFFADPDPAVFLNADPDPGVKMNADPCGSGSSLTNFVKK